MLLKNGYSMGKSTSKKELISFRVSSRTNDEVNYLLKSADSNMTRPEFLRKLLEYGLYAYQRNELQIDRSFTSYQHTLESGNEALVNDIRLLVSDSQTDLLESLDMPTLHEFLISFKKETDSKFLLLEEKIEEIKNKKKGFLR
jgi:hypothetical protein